MTRAGKRKKYYRYWYFRRNWWMFLDSIIPHWSNRECYDLDCDMVEGEAQRFWTWLFWGIVVSSDKGLN